MARRLFLVVVGFALLLAAVGVVRPVYVLAPLLGLAIWKLGYGSLASLRAGGAHIPQGPPEPVPPDERVVYWCDGCGAELLLLVRGSAAPPRHCGERMTERRETPAQSPSAMRSARSRSDAKSLPRESRTSASVERNPQPS